MSKHNGNGKTPARPINGEREAVKVLAMQVGIREAARQMGLDEHRVLKWSQRDPNGPWTVQAQIALLKPTTAQLGMSSTSSAPSVALAQSLADIGRKTRFSLARAAQNAAEYVEQAPGDEVFTNAGNFKALVGSASILHGYEADQGQGGCLSVDVLTTEGAIRVRTSGHNGSVASQDDR